MTKKNGNSKAQNVDAFLRHSDYFRRYILTDWMRRNPEQAEEMIRKVREDSIAESEVQYHLEKVADAQKAKK